MIKPEKDYKIGYKTYHNERLKKGSFHGKLTYPLYVQVIFDRVPLDFKSYYYDLYSRPKYAIKVAGKIFAPDIKEVIKKEERLAEFIIEKNRKSFSLEVFKKEYAFYSRDLLDMMELAFLFYLYLFFQDEGMPSMAETIKFGARDTRLYELVQDMKKALTIPLYTKLIENSFDYAPAYLPLYTFALKPQRTPLVSFTVMEWEQSGTKGKFIEFFKKYYPSKDVSESLKEIQKLVTHKTV